MIPDLNALTPALVLTLGGGSIVVTILVGVILSAWKPDPATKDRFGPLLSLLVGIAVVVGFAAAQGADLLTATLTGIIVGGGGIGVHEVKDGLAGG